VDPLTAAREVAASVGLDARDAAVIRETRTTIVDLAPAPVVARVWPAGQRDLDVVRRELAVTSYLARVGAPVAPPWTEAGPHDRAGLVVTLWWHIDHDPARPLDGVAAGRALREVHDRMADQDSAGLPHFARLDEVRAVAATLDLAPAEAADLDEAVALADVVVAGLDVRLQPVHGDAWLGNVLRAPGGPVWSDFERLCLGPRELDLTCNETAVRSRGRRPEDDTFLAGYGDHDVALRDRLAPLELLPLAVSTYQLAASQPAYLDLARTRLAWALDGLRG
jgi:aminoglycoside phosphotransferase (APT) family kinase protein